MYGGDDVTALVVDIGSRLTKVGYAGQDSPQSVFTSYVGSGDQTFVGDTQVYSYRSNMQVESPLQDSMISDWDRYEALWDHIFKTFRVDPSEHPMMLCEPSWNDSEQREKILELAFEKYNLPAIYFGRSAVLSAFAAGRSSALVLESGASYTSVVPVHDGYIVKKAIQKAPIGGNFISEQVLLQLKEMGIEITPHYQIQSKEPVDAMKAAKFEKNDKVATPSLHNLFVERTLNEFKEVICHVAETPLDEKFKRKPIKNFEFPNGYSHPFGIHRYKFVECLFDASFTIGQRHKSITELITSSVANVDIDLRSNLFGNVVLSGANTLLPGFADRLYPELHAAAPGVKVKVLAAGGSVERKFGPWIGGSILASLGTFYPLWISKQQYEETGPSIEKRIH